MSEKYNANDYVLRYNVILYGFKLYLQRNISYFALLSLNMFLWKWHKKNVQIYCIYAYLEAVEV